MSYEEYWEHILKVAPETEAPGPYLSLIVHVDSVRYGIPEAHVRQLVLEMYKRNLISLAVFDGRDECTLEEWRNRGLDDRTFFYNQSMDGNQVRVRTLVFGAMQRESPTKNRIGFAAS